MTMLKGEVGVAAVLREHLPMTCGLHCQSELTRADEATAYLEAARAVIELTAAPDLLEALEPFAAFLSGLETLKGNQPKTGAVWSVQVGSELYERHLTHEDFERARAAIAKASALTSSGS